MTKTDTTQYKVDLVVDKLMHGGAERFFYEIFSCLQNSSFKVRIISLGTVSEHYQELFKQIGIETIALNSNRFNPLVIFKLSRLTRGSGNKIIHAAMMKSCVLAGLLSLLPGKQKFIFHDQSGTNLHNIPHYFGFDNFIGSLLAQIYHHLLGYTARLADAVIVPLQNDYDHYTHKTQMPEKIFLIPESIDPARFESSKPTEKIKASFNIPKEHQVITMVGRLVKEKHWPVFLQSAQQIANKHHNVDFLIVGIGVLEGEIKGLLKKYDLGSRVHMLGFREDIPDILGITDIFILTSVGEHFGMSVLEAMAAGVPVIANMFGGPKEFIDDGVDGLLVQKHSPSDYAQKTLLLLENSALRKKIGANARKKVQEQYSVDVTATKLQKIYQQLAK